VTFKAAQLRREGIIHVKASIEEVFPLLCPKREEEWIPGWECETIWSTSGTNEDGAIFRTTKPYGTELYWTTLQYDIKAGVVDFLITAPHLFMLRYPITVRRGGDGLLTITFSQSFTSVSEEGSVLLSRYQGEDFPSRLAALEGFMSHYLDGMRL
jgi:hypothetical protein